ncbi:hypothetical protein [Absidia glauca]|uniref:RRM domain-containing protein n=1 Tax=Absidia glauca TaxID=4829 RepID=A0A163MPQ3_ABSGL|nr:hypothetical protein [Absidia glauca]
MGTTLFVAGFGSNTRARDLAYEFERCDIPAPKTFSAKPYAFVEFANSRDAEDSYNEMHGRHIDGYTISVQWARNAPSSSWRFDRSPKRRPRSPSPRSMPPHPPYGRNRSRSPYGSVRGRSPPPIHGYPGAGHPRQHHPHSYHHHPPPLRRGRSPPRDMPRRHAHPYARDDRSRSPPPGTVGRHSADYPPYPLASSSCRPPSIERRSSRSPSPSAVYHYRSGIPSRSPSSQRRSISPRRSPSPDQ